MASNRMNASSEPRGCPHKGKRKSQGSRDAQQACRNPSVKSDKYIHVHHYLNTGRWGAWFNDPTIPKGCGKRRLYFGTHETEYLAARAQDRAALKFKPFAVKPITRLNFAESDYDLDKELRDKLTHEQFRKLLMAESRKCYKRAEPSPCWRIFLAEEEANGNICIGSENHHLKQARTFIEVLQEIVNNNPVVNTVATNNAKEEPDSSGEEEGQACEAKRTKPKTHVAPNQPAGGPASPLAGKRSISLRPRPDRRPAPEAARPVRQPSGRGQRHATGEVRSAFRTSERSSDNPDRLVWERTGKRSMRTRPSFPGAAFSAASSEVDADEPNDPNMPMVVRVSHEARNSPSDEEDLDSEPIVENRSTRRLRIDLNCEPETSSSEDSENLPHETDGVDENEMTSAQALLMLKSGWIG